MTDCWLDYWLKFNFLRYVNEASCARQCVYNFFPFRFENCLLFAWPLHITSLWLPLYDCVRVTNGDFAKSCIRQSLCEGAQSFNWLFAHFSHRSHWVPIEWISHWPVRVCVGVWVKMNKCNTCNTYLLSGYFWSFRPQNEKASLHGAPLKWNEN